MKGILYIQVLYIHAEYKFISPANYISTSISVVCGIHKHHTILHLVYWNTFYIGRLRRWWRRGVVRKAGIAFDHKSTPDVVYFGGSGSTKPLSCHSWIQVTGPLCHWSGPTGGEGNAVAPCSLWERWAERWGSGWPAGRSGSPAAAPESWCSALPDAGSRSCSASSPEDGWGLACGAQRRRCWRCAGANAPSCWWTPSWSLLGDWVKELMSLREETSNLLFPAQKWDIDRNYLNCRTFSKYLHFCCCCRLWHLYIKKLFASYQTFTLIIHY